MAVVQPEVHVALQQVDETTLALLLTTHTALLHVTLDRVTGKSDVTVLHTAAPVYFGVTRCATGMLIAARNLGLDFRVVTDGLPCNAIWHLPHGASTPEPYLANPVLFDLHQIHAVGNWLFVTIGRGSQLAVFDIAQRMLLGCFNLELILPTDLRRTDRPSDQYHFNSISSAAGRLFVLAHNWSEGSFGLELVFDDRDGQPPTLSLQSIHRGLGHASHDIVFDNGTLFVLDGEGGALIARGHPAGHVSLPASETKPYGRGLIVTPNSIIAGYGAWAAERGERSASPTRLCVFDRASLALRWDLDLGPFGNPCALSLIGPAIEP